MVVGDIYIGLKLALNLLRGGFIMGNKKKQQRNYIPIGVEVLGLIGTAFGVLNTSYKFFWLIFGIVTCLILIASLTKEFGIGGTIGGIVISTILMVLMIIQIMKSPSAIFLDKIDEKTKIGTLELNTEELIVGYSDSNGNNRISSKIDIEKDICGEIILKSIDYDVVLEDFKIQDGKLVFSNIPVGTYDLRIQLDGFSLYSGTIKLKESELEENIWRKTIVVQNENDYKEFQIIITDREGQALKKQRCDFSICNTDYIIKDIVSDSEGQLPYTFILPSNSEFQVKVYYNEKTYDEEYLVDDISNPLMIEFSTPPKEKIPVSEVHQPNDVATIVSLPEWNVDEDMGIDGKRYGGGIKVSISDMFIGMGSNGSKDVTSRITVPLDDDYDETVFKGVFVLDQSMYGTGSTGTISILVNNEEVFTTGEIDGNTLDAFPFNVNFGDADSLIILTEAHLAGSDFVYGFVAEK